MREILVLDGGPVGDITGDPGKPRVIVGWTGPKVADSGAKIVVPGIADYEVRREFHLRGAIRRLQRLDALEQTLILDPITIDVMELAAELWAKVRLQGRPTADRHALDADVILAAQATLLAAPGDHVIVATTNVKHLARYVDARNWATMG
jgi:predicted nucleic acid-binding protein